MKRGVFSILLFNPFYLGQAAFKTVDTYETPVNAPSNVFIIVLSEKGITLVFSK